MSKSKVDYPTALEKTNLRLLKALNTLVKAINVKEPDPLVIFVSIEQAQDAIAQANLTLYPH